MHLVNKKYGTATSDGNQTITPFSKNQTLQTTSVNTTYVDSSGLWGKS